MLRDCLFRNIVSKQHITPAQVQAAKQILMRLKRQHVGGDLLLCNKLQEFCPTAVSRLFAVEIHTCCMGKHDMPCTFNPSVSGLALKPQSPVSTALHRIRVACGEEAANHCKRVLEERHLSIAAKWELIVQRRRLAVQRSMSQREAPFSKTSPC